MYIVYDEFMDFVKAMELDNYVSPGGLAHRCGVTRQTVNYWVNTDLIDAHRYEGREGQYTLIHVSEFKKITESRGIEISL